MNELEWYRGSLTPFVSYLLLRDEGRFRFSHLLVGGPYEQNETL